MNAVLRSASKPRHAMYATMFTVVLNTILDPLFIWTFGLGIRGAAYATVLSQFVALIWQFWIFSNPKELIRLKRGIYSLRGDLVKNIIGIGISPFSMNVCACMVVIFINNQLVRFGGDMSVGAFGIANRIVFIFVMFVMGINQGMQPIAGYNYGAQKLDRMMQVVKLSIIAATAIMILGWFLAMLAPRQCVSLFTTDQHLIDTTVHGMQRMMMMLPIVGYQMVITNFFQCIGKVKISIFLSLSRQLLFLLPALALLPMWFGLDGVWLAQPVSDLIASVVTAWIMIVYMHKFKLQHKENQYGRQE